MLVPAFVLEKKSKIQQKKNQPILQRGMISLQLLFGYVSTLSYGYTTFISGSYDFFVRIFYAIYLSHKIAPSQIFVLVMTHHR